MRILWIDDDRSMRVCDFWTPLRLALAKQVHVEAILRPLPMLEGRFCRECTIKGMKLPSLLDPSYVNEFDWILVPAMWAYLDEPWDRITAKRAILWADQHGPMVSCFMARALDLDFELYLPKYRDASRYFHPGLPPERVEWLPYWVDTSYLRDYGLRKTIGMLHTGVLHQQVYPYRTAVYEALKSFPWFERIERPVETMEGKYWPVYEDYGRLINTSHIASACTSRYHYSLTKLFEVPACRTALLCDTIPEMSDLGFIPWVNYLPLDGGVGILEIAQHWLNKAHRSDLEQLTDAGYQLMQQRHTTDTRASELVRILSHH